eukprot:885591-Rhodomonas_salina.1
MSGAVRNCEIKWVLVQIVLTLWGCAFDSAQGKCTAWVGHTPATETASTRSPVAGTDIAHDRSMVAGTEMAGTEIAYGG